MADHIDFEEEKLKQHQSHSLPWIADPFSKHSHHHYHPPHVPSPTPPPQSNKEYITSEVIPTVEQQLDEAEEEAEATPIELFYDLYFVANLTTVTSVHYITERFTLASYCLYFIILWFTWLHVTLLDVRFSVDSIYERVCKGLHFATMAAFASVSTMWDPFDPETPLTVRSLRIMTLTLMFSRFVLMIQYTVVMVYAMIKKGEDGERKTKAVVRLAMHAVIMGVSGVVYLGLYFSFGDGKSGRSYLVWYAMLIFEAVGVVVASMSESLPFPGARMVERMALLTLIVLGEGIIVMLKAINTIVKGFGWDKSTVGVVIAALTVIYFFWMFYFDMTPKEAKLGKLSQHLWAIFHFPLHLGLVLSVEGLRQLTTLHNYTQMQEELYGKVHTGDPALLLNTFNRTFDLFYKDVYAKTVLLEWSTIKNWTALLDGIVNQNMTMNATLPASYTAGQAESTNPTETNTEQWLSYLRTSLLNKANDCLREFYGLKLPYASAGEYTTKDTQYRALFDLVYKYFFISLGFVFVLYGLFSLLARKYPRLDVYDWLSISLRWIAAAVFFGMAGLKSDNPLYDYQRGAWPIPQICVLLFLVLLADKGVNYLAQKPKKTPSTSEAA